MAERGDGWVPRNLRIDIDNLVTFGDIWCHLMNPKKPNRVKERRFSVSLTNDDYERLQGIRRKSRQKVPLTLVVNVAIQKLLDGTKNGRLEINVAAGTRTKKV
jgi:hypothetical protein